MRPLTLLATFTASTFLSCGLLRAEEAKTMSATYDSTKDTLVYVGTYTQGTKSKGIYAYRLVTATDGSVSLESLGLAAETANPAFLEVDAKRRLVFAINELGTFNGKSTGAVSAFSIDRKTGALKLINQQSSGGSGPCHLALDQTGKNLIIANYGAGSTSVVPVAADGTLGEAKSVIQHLGKSVHPQRQTGPHAHCATLSADNNFTYICDLGLDQILAYRLDPAKGELKAAAPAFTATKPGAGPRHLALGRGGKFAYVLNELDSTVGAYAVDASNGKLTELQTLSSLPAGYTGKSTGAEIAVHPSGRWLYASNRGQDSIAYYEIDTAKGTLRYGGETSTGGKEPRHFALTPSGKHLVIGNQKSNTVVFSRIDDATGKPGAVGAATEVPAPVCIVFVPPAK